MHFAFTRLPVASRPDLATEILSEEPVALVLPKGHRLAAEESVRLEQIAGEDIVLIDRKVEPELHDYYVAACNAAGFSPRVAHEVNSTSVAIGLVAGGLGVGFVPSSARLAPQHNVAYVPITGSRLTLTIGAMWNAGPRPSVLDNFLQLRPWELSHGTGGRTTTPVSRAAAAGVSTGA
jgi:DNA-binding transcriptional LysR family regulator